jgi:hypothetical protein
MRQVLDKTHLEMLKTLLNQGDRRSIEVLQNEGSHYFGVAPDTRGRALEL